MEEQTHGQGIEQIYQFDPLPEKKKRGRKGLKIWLIIVLCIVAFFVVMGLAVNWLFGDSVAPAPEQPYVGVLYVEGAIVRGNTDSWGRAVDYQHDFSINAIENLIYDSYNRGLILYVNSPGGGIYESDELYLKIREYKEATGRPVYAYMASMAASGGYYISAPADMIFANRNCWTGSIGVTIGTFYNISGFLETYGIDTVTITSGRNKAMGSMVDPLTNEQIAIFQALVDEAYDQFVGIVAEERQMDAGTVRELADGRIYTALQAEENGLIDAVATYEEALTHMADTYDLGHALLYDIYYKDDSFISQLLGRLPLPERYGSDADVILSLIRSDTGFPISYLCTMLRSH